MKNGTSTDFLRIFSYSSRSHWKSSSSSLPDTVRSVVWELLGDMKSPVDTMDGVLVALDVRTIIIVKYLFVYNIIFITNNNDLPLQVTFQIQTMHD